VSANIFVTGNGDKMRIQTPGVQGFGVKVMKGSYPGKTAA